MFLTRDIKHTLRVYKFVWLGLAFALLCAIFMFVLCMATPVAGFVAGVLGFAASTWLSAGIAALWTGIGMVGVLLSLWAISSPPLLSKVFALPRVLFLSGLFTPLLSFIACASLMALGAASVMPLFALYVCAILSALVVSAAVSTVVCAVQKKVFYDQTMKKCLSDDDALEKIQKNSDALKELGISFSEGKKNIIYNSKDDLSGSSDEDYPLSDSSFG